MKRYIVTGAPGAGKTAVIRQLEVDGFSVVEEAATDVIALCQAKGILEPWTGPEFIDAVVRLQQVRERRGASVADAVQFHDRSVVCTAALAEYLGFAMPRVLVDELRRLSEHDVFDRRVLLFRNLGFVTPTEARRITYEETVRFEEIHERTYQELGFQVISIGAGTVADRVRQVRSELGLDRV